MPTTRVPPSSLRQFNAVVLSAGLMQKTVKARIGVQKWNKKIGKKFNLSQNLLVHDPASSLRTGDVISISNGWRTSKHVHHVVNHIIAPFGEPISARPPVPSLEERLEVVRSKKRAKDERKRTRELEERGGGGAAKEDVVVEESQTQTQTQGQKQKS